MDSAILLFLSLYKANRTSDAPPQTQRYYAEIPGIGLQQFSGMQTNDAPCKYLLRKAAAEGNPVSTILCLVSREDLKTIHPVTQIPLPYRITKKDLMENPDAKNNSYTYFCKMISNYTHRIDDLPEPEIIMIPYDCNPEEAGFDPDKKKRHRDPASIDSYATAVYSRIAQQLSGRNLKQLYVDFTGGMRDTAFLLMELSRFLGFIDIPCKEIVYSNYHKKEILSLRSAYAMFPVLNGISSFLDTGNAKKLREAYATYTDTNDPIVNGLLEHLTAFSQAISLCSLSNIDTIYGNVLNSLELLEHYEASPESDITAVMLKDFVPKIREKLYIHENEVVTSYLGLIRWCVDNGMLQQALTLYVERIPAHCMSKALLRRDLITKFKKDKDINPELSCFEEIVKRECNISQVAEDADAAAFKAFLQDFYNEYAYQCSRSRNTALRNSFTRAYSRIQTNLCKQLANEHQKYIEANFYLPGGACKTTEAKKYRNLLDFLQKTSTDNAFCASRVKKYRESHGIQAKTTDADRTVVWQEKKINFLQILEEKTNVSAYTNRLTPQQFFNLFLHYYTIRSVRNRVNHALEDNETALLEYYQEKCGIDTLNLEYSGVETILCAGIQYMLDLENSLTQKQN